MRGKYFGLFLGAMVFTCAPASAQQFFVIKLVDGIPPNFNPGIDPEDYIITTTVVSVGPTSPSFFLYDHSVESLCLNFASQSAIGPVSLDEPFMNTVFSQVTRDGDFAFTLSPGFPDQALVPGTYFEVIHAEEFTLQANCFVPEPLVPGFVWLAASCIVFRLRGI